MRGMEALWVAAAFAMGWFANRLGFPPLVGYLLAGLGLALNGQKSGEVTHQLADVGVLLLLFTVGLKLRWQSLFGKEVLAGGTIHMALFGLLAFALVGQNWLIAGAVAFSSTVLAVKLLETRSELGTLHGRVAVGILVLQDLAAMAILASLGAKQPTLWALGIPLLALLRPVIHWVVDKSGHNELILLFGIGLAVGFGAIFRAVGISPELGALFAGALMVGHPQAGEIGKTMWSVKEFFLVAFFMQMGMWGLPSASGWWSVAILLALLPVKAALFFGLFVLLRLTARTAFVAAIGLASYSEFALIVGAGGAKAGLLSQEWMAILSLTVLVSLVVATPLSRHVHTLYERFEHQLHRFELKGAHSDDEPVRLGRAQWVVVGMGRTGAAAYRTLEEAGNKVVGLDADLNKIQTQLSKKRRVVYGDAEDPDLWENLHVDSLEGVLLTLPDLEAKLRAAESLRERGYKGVIGATSHHKEEDELLTRAGCDYIFYPFSAAGELLASRALAIAAQPKPS